MTYEHAMKRFKKLPAHVQRDIHAAMIEYFQSAPLYVTLTATKKRHRERRYFIKLVDDYLNKR